MTTIPVVTVDGPSGVGKGTLSRLLAKTLNWHYLDSGALYRLTALQALHEGVALDDEAALAVVTRALDIHFELREGSDDIVHLHDRRVGDELRSETCGKAASQVAALPQVRAALLQKQRDFLRPPGLVADGRDMGSVVFADAPVKIFLWAEPEERAARRYKQLREKGLDVTLSKLTQEIRERDERDSQRKVSPLKPATDADILDSTNLAIDAVTDRALALIDERLGTLQPGLSRRKPT